MGPVVDFIHKKYEAATFANSNDYWTARYRAGGNSGPGSYGRLAKFKSEIINQKVRDYNIQSLIEFGCGDGNQLATADYPRYTGVDISTDAVNLCRKKFAHEDRFQFVSLEEYRSEKADASMSLDVLFHLVELDVFHDYLSRLFDAAERFVIVYSCDVAMPEYDSPHVVTRNFTDWVAENRKEFSLVDKIDNPYTFDVNNPDTSFADFYIFEKK